MTIHPYRALTATMAIAFTALLIGCGQPFSPVANDTELTVPVTEPASLSFTFSVPEFPELAESGSSESRAIAPQTASAALLLGGVEHSEIFGTLTTDSWTGTFTGVPAATYAAGEITVELRDGSGAALTRGSTTQPVTVADGQTSSVAISCIPANPTPLTHLAPQTDSIASNTMTYYSFDVTAGSRHKVWIRDASAEGLAMLFDAQGRVLARQQVYRGDWRAIVIDPRTTGTYYLGVYGAYEYGGSMTSYEVMFADPTPHAAVVYEARPQNADGFTLQLESEATTDLGQFDQGYPESWEDNLQFEILNLGGEGYLEISSFTFTPSSSPLALQQAPQDTQIGWAERFYLDLDQESASAGAETATISFDYDLMDEYGTAVSTGHAFTATVEVEIVEPRPQMDVRVYYPTASNTESIENEGTWDIGQIVRDSEDSMFFDIRNEGRGNLEVTSVDMTDPTGQVTNLDTEARTTIPGDSDWRSFWMHAGDTPGPYSVTFTINSNAPSDPFSFTLEFEVVDYYGDPTVRLWDGWSHREVTSGTAVDMGPFFTASGSWGFGLNVENVGTNVLNVSSAAFSGNPGALAVGAYPTTPIDPGADDWIDVSFDTNEAAGSYTETLAVETDDPTGTHTLDYTYSLVTPGDVVVRLRNDTWGSRRSMPSDATHVYDLSRLMDDAWVGYTDRFYLEVRNEGTGSVTLTDQGAGVFAALSGSTAFSYVEMRDGSWDVASDGVIPAGESAYVGLELLGTLEDAYETTVSLAFDSGPTDYTLNLEHYVNDPYAGVAGTISYAANAGSTNGALVFYLDTDTDPSNGFERDFGMEMLGETTDYRVDWHDGEYYVYAWSDEDGSGAVDAGDYYGIADPFTITGGSITAGIDVTVTQQ